MNRDWQPGDVAWLTVRGQSSFKGMRSAERGGSWITAAPVDGEHVHLSGDVDSARPVVDIDPEDFGEMERLAKAWDNLADKSVEPGPVPMSLGAYRMQAALREFADPTPSEPTDPKARVTDRRENVWRLLADGDWVCTDGPDVGEYLVWWQLAERGPLAVEGVTA